MQSNIALDSQNNPISTSDMHDLGSRNGKDTGNAVKAEDGDSCPMCRAAASTKTTEHQCITTPLYKGQSESMRRRPNLKINAGAAVPSLSPSGSPDSLESCVPEVFGGSDHDHRCDTDPTNVNGHVTSRHRK